MPVTSCPSTFTATVDGSTPDGSTTSTSASPALTRSARLDSTLMSVAEQLGPLPGAGEPSHELAQSLSVPPIAAQREASLETLHFVPDESCTQQVTAPGLPQVETDSHRLTNG